MQRVRLGPIRTTIGVYFLCLVCFAISGSIVPLQAQNSAAELTGMWKATVGDGPMMQGM